MALEYLGSLFTNDQSMDTSPAEVTMLPMPPKPPFPKEVKVIFDALRSEVTLLHSYWEEYQELFGSKKSIAALNGVAAGAFGLIGYTFRHEMIMAFSRITDPKKTCGKDNLTFNQLLHVLRQHCSDKTFLKRLEAIEKDIAVKCNPIRQLRNRSIGHLDLQTALKFHPDPLPDVGKNHVIEALELIAHFMNQILGYYTYSHADFVPVVHGPARNIVHAMREFKRLQKEEDEREIAALHEE